MPPYQRLFDLFERAGHPLYLVGGCVRDHILSRQPKDHDFTTDATPRQVKNILRGGGLRYIAVAEAFGTIVALLPGQAEPLEITTYRTKESFLKTSKGRGMVFGKELLEDLSRRDLSINAMAMSRDGEIIDPFGGAQDIAEGILRVPGGGLEKSREIFSDDPLRVLRVARFISRFGFSPEAPMTVAAKEIAPLIAGVSTERWEAEFSGLLLGKHPRLALEWLSEVGALEVCLPELTTLRDGEGWMLRLYEETLDCIETLLPDATLRWAGLLHGATVAWGLSLDPQPAMPLLQPPPSALLKWGRGFAEEVTRRFKFSRQRAKALVYLLSEQATLEGLSGEVIGRVAARRWILNAGSLREVLSDLSLNLAKLHGSTVLERVESQLVSIAKHEQILLIEGPLAPQLPKGIGHLLAKELQLPNGPIRATVIRWLKASIIDETLPNQANATLYVDATREWLQEQSISSS